MGIVGEAIVSIVNLSVVVISLLIYAFKGKIISIIRNKNNREFFRSIISKFRIKRVSWTNVGLSIAILFFLDFAIMNFTRTVWPPEENLVSPGFILSSFIAPIGEEILFRGLVFGVMFLVLIPLLIKILKVSKKELDKNRFYLVAALVLQSLLFTVMHENPHLVNFLIRFLGGLVYGFLYILNKYNLLPSMITHLAHNLFINSGLYEQISFL